MNDIRVRRAVAYGLNRQLVVRSFYAGRAQVAHEFMPPSLQGYEPKVTKYAFNPTRARQLLREANCGPPCRIQFWYPTGVSRPYMPDPKANFEAFKASLEQSGFEVETTSMPWRPDYVKNVNQGTAGHLNLIGWTGDYADADNFIGTFFQGGSPQFGFNNAALNRLLDRAEQETNQAKRIRLYKQANRLIMQQLPGVPYAHSVPALGMQKRVLGYFTSPIGTDEFERFPAVRQRRSSANARRPSSLRPTRSDTASTSLCGVSTSNTWRRRSRTATSVSASPRTDG